MIHRRHTQNPLSRGPNGTETQRLQTTVRQVLMRSLQHTVRNLLDYRTTSLAEYRQEARTHQMPSEPGGHGIDARLQGSKISKRDPSWVLSPTCATQSPMGSGIQDVELIVSAVNTKYVSATRKHLILGSCVKNAQRR